MDRYDVVVIGGGPGGYVSAQQLAKEGKTVAVIEQSNVGGTCLNKGCIPTKALLHCAKQYNNICHSSDYGIEVTEVRYDHKAVVKRKDNIVEALSSGIVSIMKTLGVEVINEHAVIKGKQADGFVVSAGDIEIIAEKLIVATGSTPTILPIPGIEDGIASGFVKTSTDLLDLKQLPKAMVCIGGGVIGLEMACYFATVGVDVTVVEMLPQIVGSMDADISRTLIRSYKKLGIKFLLGAKVCDIKSDMVCVIASDGNTHEISCDSVLIAAGRTPVTTGFGIESIGVKIDKGAIVTDKRMRTNIEGVYAVGDCNGKVMLAHTAYREAEVVANDIMGVDDSMRYDTVASVIYTYPEAASVGISSETAKNMDLDIRQVKIPMRTNGRNLAQLQTDGFCKLIYDTQKDCIISVSIVGNCASEIIEIGTIMVESELPLERLRKMVFPHPTVSEIIKEAIFALQ